MNASRHIDLIETPRPAERARLERMVAHAATPAERAAALYELGRYLYGEDLQSLGGMLDEMEDAAEQLHDEALLARVCWLRGVYLRDTSTGDFGMAAFERSYQIASTLGDDDAAANALLHLSRIHDRHGDYRAAIAVLESCLPTADRLSLDQQTQLFARLGINHLQTGDLAEAHAFALRAMEAAEGSGSEHDRLTAYAFAGGLYHRLGMNARARELMLRTLAFTDSVTGGMTQYNNLGAIEAGDGNYRAAVRYFNQAVKLARQRKAPHTVAQALANRAAAQTMLGNLASATRDAASALGTARAIGDRALEAMAQGTLGRAQAAGGKHAEAIANLEQSLATFTAIGRRASQCLAHKYLADIYATTGRAQKALRHLRRHVALHEEIYNPGKLEAMADVLFALEQKRAQQEREILRLRAAELERAMEANNTRLAALALELVRKRELLDAIDTRLRTVAAVAGPGTQPLLENLLREIRSNQGTDEEWAAFEEQFSRVHGPFLARLERQFPTLTGTELRICALMRVNLDTKEIARLLSTSVRTVQNHRYNIRRKLAIPERESLGHALAGLG